MKTKAALLINNGCKGKIAYAIAERVGMGFHFTQLDSTVRRISGRPLRVFYRFAGKS